MGEAWGREAAAGLNLAGQLGNRCAFKFANRPQPFSSVSFVVVVVVYCYCCYCLAPRLVLIAFVHDRGWGGGGGVIVARQCCARAAPPCDINNARWLPHAPRISIIIIFLFIPSRALFMFNVKLLSRSLVPPPPPHFGARPSAVIQHKIQGGWGGAICMMRQKAPGCVRFRIHSGFSLSVRQSAFVRLKPRGLPPRIMAQHRIFTVRRGGCHRVFPG